MLTRIAHTCLGSSDLEATERFYVEVLGCAKAFDFIKDGARFGFYLAVGEGTFIEVFKDGAERAEPGRQRIRHLAIEVADIDAVEAALQAAGCMARGKKVGGDGSWQLWTEDPDGVQIEFQQYTDASSQRTGKDVIVDW